jgi:hypothetical protein
MNQRRITSLTVLGAAAGALLIGCAESTPLASDAAAIVAVRSGDRCINVAADIDVPLGAWLLDGELVVGGAPSPITLDGIDGWMASAVRDERSVGRSGTTHLTLNHVFVTEEPLDLGLPAIFLDQVESYFLTEDRAVCAAGSDATSCRINDRMRVVEGAGIFANAGGFLQNHGTISFVPEPGRLVSRLHGRVCGDGIGG